MNDLLAVGRVFLACCVLVAASGAAAEDGVTKDAIVLGQSGEFSGQGVAKEGIDGAQAYFAAVNKRGGVFGRRIELKAYDDGRDVKRVLENTERLIREDKVFALFGYRGTPSIEAAIPVATRDRVPFIAPFSGARSIREPANPMVFHLRASYAQEAAKIVVHLGTLGIKKIAILYQDDAFGKDGLTGFQESLKAQGMEPVAVAQYDRRDMKVDDAAAKIAGAAPDAVAMACSPKACIDFIRQVRAKGQRTQFLTLSNVNSDDFARALKDDGRGVVVAQVVPYPWSPIVPLAREFQQLAQGSGAQLPISYASFEGFIAAKLLVTALQKTGPEPTREKFLAALEGMGEADLGGMAVRFSRKAHGGSNFVDLTLIDREGKYIR
jgi:branched-chain amino acid transport system substrate-binding protein